MRFIAVILSVIVSLSQVVADETYLEPDFYGAIHQAEFILAETLDTKNYARLGESMTNDVIYDSRPLGPDYGGLSVGLAQTTANIKAAFGDARIAHHVSNAIIKPLKGLKAANVTTYIVWSRWDPVAITDPKKTFRIFERCDDVFVIDDGKWKLKYSLVTQLGPKPESPIPNG